MVSATALCVWCALLAVPGHCSSDDTSLLQVGPAELAKTQTKAAAASEAEGPSEIWEDFEDWRVGMDPGMRMVRRQVREQAKAANMAQDNFERQMKMNAKAAAKFQKNSEKSYNMWTAPMAKASKSGFEMQEETVKHMQKMSATQAVHEMKQQAEQSKVDNKIWRDRMRNEQQELRQGSRDFTKSWRDFQTKDSKQKQMWKRDVQEANAMAPKMRKQQREATEVAKRQLKTVEVAAQEQARVTNSIAASTARHAAQVMKTTERLGNEVQEGQAQATRKVLNDLRSVQGITDRNAARQANAAIENMDANNRRSAREERAMERITDRTERAIANSAGKVGYDTLKHLSQEEKARQQVYRDVLNKHAATDLKDMAMDAAWKDASIAANKEITTQTLQEIQASPVVQIGEMANAVSAMVAQNAAQVKAQTDVAMRNAEFARAANMATETARQAAEALARQKKAVIQRQVMMSQGDDD